MPTRQRWSPLGVGAVVAVPVALVVATLSGALTPLALGDPGPVVRLGLPVLRVLHDLAAASTIGLLLVAAFLAPEARDTQRRAGAARAAALTAVVWTCCAVAGLLLTFAAGSGLAPGHPQFWQVLAASLWPLELTRLLLIGAALAALVVPAAALARTRAALAWTFLLALAALVPLSLGGHANGTLGHEQAMTGLLVHLVAMSLWVGGLTALVLLRPVLGAALDVTVRRFSPVALGSYVALAGSGVLFALVRLDSLDDLTSRYGAVLAAKVAALVTLGWFGWRHRSRLLAGGLGSGRAFTRFALAEIALMGAALGLSVALARTPPPETAPGDVTDRALALTGYPSPGPYTAQAWLTTFEPFWVFLIAAAVAVGLYLAGVRRLRRRGDSWPVGRTVVWVLGWALLVYATSGAPGVYGRVMFSMHMAMHMTLMMAVPILLVPAAPITLALRALPARRDRTLGPREVVLGVAHARWVQVLANPVVAAVIFFGSLVGFYWTDAFELALSTHPGHVLMVTHFALTGYLFVSSLIGVDPGPPKWPAPLRLMVLFTTLAGHAFFGLAMMSGSWLLAPGFFKALAVPWVPDLLADQQLGGTIAWGVGEIPTLLLALLVTRDWMRRDEREAARSDRRAERDDDAELAAYNARLQKLASGSGSR